MSTMSSDLLLKTTEKLINVSSFPQGQRRSIPILKIINYFVYLLPIYKFRYFNV